MLKVAFYHGKKSEIVSDILFRTTWKLSKLTCWQTKFWWSPAVKRKVGITHFYDFLTFPFGLTNIYETTIFLYLTTRSSPPILPFIYRAESNFEKKLFKLKSHLFLNKLADLTVDGVAVLPIEWICFAVVLKRTFFLILFETESRSSFCDVKISSRVKCYVSFSDFLLNTYVCNGSIVFCLLFLSVFWCDVFLKRKIRSLFSTAGDLK